MAAAQPQHWKQARGGGERLSLRRTANLWVSLNSTPHSNNYLSQGVGGPRGRVGASLGLEPLFHKVAGRFFLRLKQMRGGGL